MPTHSLWIMTCYCPDNFRVAVHVWKALNSSKHWASILVNVPYRWCTSYKHAQKHSCLMRCLLQYCPKQTKLAKYSVNKPQVKWMSDARRMSLSNIPGAHHCRGSIYLLMATETTKATQEEMVSLCIPHMQRHHNGEYSNIVRPMHAIDKEMDFSYLCMSTHSMARGKAGEIYLSSTFQQQGNSNCFT